MNDLDLLRAADPVDGRTFTPPVDGARRAMAATRPVPRRASRRIAVWAPVVAAATVVAAAGIPAVVERTLTPHSAYAAALPGLLPIAAPGPGGVPTLAAVAATAERSHDGVARPRTTTTMEWSLFTRVEAGAVSNEVVPVLRRTQILAPPAAVEGSDADAETVPARVWTVEGPHQTAGTVAVPVPSVAEAEPKDERLSVVYPTAPPTTAAAMAAYLARAHPIAEDGTAEMVVAVGDLLDEWRLGPAQRSALLAVLATRTDLHPLGTATDRVGRRGVAYGVDSDRSGLPSRTILVVDPVDGQVLAIEEVLTKNAGKLGVPIPSTTSYTLFLDPAPNGPEIEHP